MPTSGKPHARRPPEVRAPEDLAPLIKRELRRLGLRLRALRQERGLTQEQAAEAMGIHPKSLPRIEGGRANLTVATLVAAAAAFKVSLCELFPPEHSDK